VPLYFLFVLEDLRLGIVTYGGHGDRYQPQFHDITDNSVNTIRNLLNSFSFNGPIYSHNTTAKALRYAADNLRSTSDIDLKNLVVVAPESSENVSIFFFYCNVKQKTRCCLNKETRHHYS